MVKMEDDRLAGTTTLSEVIQRRAEISENKNWLTLYKKDRIEAKLSFGDLLSAAQSWAALLADYDVRPKDRVLIVLPTEQAFYESFWGILEAGATPVPLYPPVRLGQINEYLDQLRRIIDDGNIVILITNRQIAPLLETLKGNGCHLLKTNEVDLRQSGISVDSNSDGLALLQYTSGSTGNQKGVMLTHNNLLANLRDIGKRLRPNADDIALSWLPLYHDMGLIGLMMGSVYFGVPLIAFSPIDFLRKPIRWIRLMSLHRATFSAAPNFAYNLLARKIKEKDLDNIDLSNWRIALCGAEPIHAATIRDFIRRFGPVGFDEKAFFPAYGLAENSLAVSFSEIGTPPTIKRFSKKLLQAEGKAVEQTGANGDVSMVSVGRPLDTVQVTILDENGIPLGPNVQGEIAIKGPSTTIGYFKNPSATAGIRKNGWLHTGDLGFIANGQLYISGRQKDMVIRAGRNYFAEDLEAAVGSFPGIRPGGICVFGVKNRQRGTEKVVLLAEAASKGDHAKMIKGLKQKMAATAGFRPDVVQIVPARTLPKTSSGKLQRYKARQRYVDGTLQDFAGNQKAQGLWIYLKAVLTSNVIGQKMFSSIRKRDLSRSVRNQ